MTKMAKRNKAILWTCVAAIAALLVALVFVGVTFARYTSSSTGSGSAGVARWEVTAGDKFDVDADAGTFSPSPEEFQESQRTNVSDHILIAELANTGDVDALVFVDDVDTSTMTFIWDDEKVGAVCSDASDASLNTDGTYNSGTHASGSCDNCDFCTHASTYYTNIADHFSVALSYSTSDSEASTWLDFDENGVELAKTTGVIYIYAQVTWISDITDCYGDTADDFDTWLGHYLSKITFEISFHADQTSTSGGGN